MPVHLFSGTLQATRHLMLTLRLRTGQRLIVDAAPAAAASNAPHAFVIGEALTAQGSLIAGVLVATSVTVTTPAARDWVPDR